MITTEEMAKELIKENKKMKAAISATLRRSEGNLYSTDQLTGETFYNILNQSIGNTHGK
jgi:hypothetical protein